MGSIVVGAIVSGSIYALVSLGFALAFRVSSVFNLAHGILLVSAGYLNYWLTVGRGWSTWSSIPLTLLTVGLAGFLVEAILIPSAKLRGLTPVDLLILSWLLLIVLQDILAMAFESQSIYLGTTEVVEGWDLLGGKITPLQIVTIVVAAIAGSCFIVLIKYWSRGHELLAVGDDPRLSLIYGLNVRQIIGLNALLASLLTGGAGILMSYQERLDPTLGFRFSIVAIVSTLIGYPLGPGGAVVGAFALALLETLVLYLVDPGLRDAAVYACLFVVVAWMYRSSHTSKER